MPWYVAVAIGVSMYALCRVPVSARRRSSPFVPARCYVCDHQGPVGELVYKLPCCVVCRRDVLTEVAKAIDPEVERPDGWAPCRNNCGAYVYAAAFCECARCLLGRLRLARPDTAYTERDRAQAPDWRPGEWHPRAREVDVDAVLKLPAVPQ